MSDALPLLAVTLGDPNGIGPEVALKAALDDSVRDNARIALVGPHVAWKERALHTVGEIPTLESFEELGTDVPLCVVDSWDGRVACLRAFTHRQALDAVGRISVEAGRLAMQSVELATHACMVGTSDALVTAPISKEAIRLAGYPFPGHTEFLAKLTGVDDVVMVLATNRLGTPLRVALATIHVPVSEVSERLSIEGITTTLTILSEELTSRFGIENPTIAVLGLNPHAGEGGTIGDEEIEVIAPAIAAADSQGIKATGPHSADAFFGQGRWKEVDVVLAMYHDQGLAPFKALAMGKGVNVTLGLPIVRTSPDHGTAFDIAGQGVADPSSMIEAMLMAAEAADSTKS